MADYSAHDQLKYDNEGWIRCLVEIVPRDFVEQDIKNPRLQRINLFYATATDILRSDKHKALRDGLTLVTETETRTLMELNQRVGEGRSGNWNDEKVQQELNGELFIERFSDYLMTATSLVILKENRALLSNDAIEEIADDVRDEFDLDDETLIPSSFYDTLDTQYIDLLLKDARTLSNFCGSEKRGRVVLDEAAILKAMKIVDRPFPTYTLS